MFRGVQHASLYKTFRPVYPPTLVDRIIQFVKRHNTAPQFERAVDVGCGSGQLTSLLAPHYQHVLGVDESPEQIRQASEENKLQNVKYEPGFAEKLNLNSSSIDLICAAQCIHWLNKDKFYNEVKRVLKPKGTLAIITYGLATLERRESPEISRKMTAISDELFGYFRDRKFMDERAVQSKYFGHELQVPFDVVEKDGTLFLMKDSTIKDYVGFVSSTSYYNKHMEANPSDSDFLQRFKDKLIEAAGCNADNDDYEILLKHKLDITLACNDK